MKNEISREQSNEPLLRIFNFTYNHTFTHSHILMKRLLVFSFYFIVSIVATSGIAQQRYDLNNFTGIKSEGSIPADLRKPLGELYGEDKQRVRDYNDGKLANRDRVLEASYHINRLMSNGRILYGDPITRMVERIADTLLKDYSELRRELRFYTVKSSSVNAFATGQGMIFVTTGLVAQVENESQLAYVISHEIVHYYRKHNMEVLTRRIKTSDDEAEQMADFLKYHYRSREMENEADSLGLRLFYIGSAYDKRVTDGIFDVLQYATLPFDEVPFDTTYFNSSYYRLPSHYFLKEVAAISSRDDYPDSLSTHPNIKKRRARTGDILSHYQGGSQYVVTTAEEFARLRGLARFECIRQNLIYANYTRAFYDCYVLERQYPNNAFLARSKAQALYGIAMYKTYYNTNTIVGNYKSREGEIQQLYYLFRQLTAEEATLLAVREVWKTLQTHPSDPQLEAMGRDLMVALRDKHSLSRTSFSATYETAATVQTEEGQGTSTANQKYARIRQKQQQNHIADQSRYAFTDFMMQGGNFRRWMDDCLDAPAVRDTADWRAKATLLYAPQYIVVENTKESDVKYRKSDRMEQALVGKVREAATAAGMPVVDFSDPAMRNHTDAEFYNDFVAINEWANEFWQSKGNVPLSLSTQPLMNDLNQRYDADKLSLNMVVNSEYDRFGSFYAMALGALFPPSFPIFAYEYFANREITITRNLLIDTRKARIMKDQAKQHNYTDSKDLVTNDIYSTYHAAFASSTPGFLGRRLAVTAQMGMDFPVMNRLFERYPEQNVDLRPGVQLEFVTAPRQSLAVGVDYNKTTFYVTNGYVVGSTYRTESGHVYDTRVLSAALSYRWYVSDMFAPLGPYLGLGAYVSKIDLLPKAEQVLRNRLGDTTYTRYGIQVEAGRNYILANKVLLNIGLRYSFTIANPFHYEDWDNIIPTEQDRIRHAEINALRQMNANLWMAQLMIVNIGLGFLPF